MFIIVNTPSSLSSQSLLLLFTISFPLLFPTGVEEACEPQPIPALLVGYDKEWLSFAPQALKFWDKLLLEPHGKPRDIAYVVVAPDSDFLLGHVKKFFKELSTSYELMRLGKHCPIAKVLRDGIMRVGKTAAKNLSDQPIDSWFTHLGDGPVAGKLRLYAQACRHHLGKRNNWIHIFAFGRWVLCTNCCIPNSRTVYCMRMIKLFFYLILKWRLECVMFVSGCALTEHYLLYILYMNILTSTFLLQKNYWSCSKCCSFLHLN